MARNATRLVQLLGVVVAAFGLWGFWQAADPAEATPLSKAEAALVNPGAERFRASFVVAGRDIEYFVPARDPIYQGGRLVGFGTPASGKYYPNRTDSIFYVQFVGDKVYVIAIPRDIWLDELSIKINSTMAYRGADGLRREVGKLLKLPVDYYAIINIDIFERLVDAFGGVDVYVPYDMRYTDTAASLYIDFRQGPQHLTGADAASFVRYRRAVGGDHSRIDNIKLVATAMAAKLRAFDLRALAGLPEVLGTLFEEVTTNAEPAVVMQILSRARNLDVVSAVLPVSEDEIWVDDRQLGRIRQDIQRVSGVEVDAFLAQTFGGAARGFEGVPESNVVISNRSGWAGLEEIARARLVAFGVPEAHIITQELFPDGLPTRVQAERDDWESAAFYANMLNVQRAQVYRINRPSASGTQGVPLVGVGLELVLGRDAARLLTPPGLTPSALSVSLLGASPDGLQHVAGETAASGRAP